MTCWIKQLCNKIMVPEGVPRLRENKIFLKRIAISQRMLRNVEINERFSNFFGMPRSVLVNVLVKCPRGRDITCPVKRFFSV